MLCIALPLSSVITVLSMALWLYYDCDRNKSKYLPAPALRAAKLCLYDKENERESDKTFIHYYIILPTNCRIKT